MKTVIVVDDNDLSLSVTVEMLKELGFDVFPFGLPEEAINFSSGKGIDLVVADIGLPEIKGNDLAMRIKKNQPAIEVLLISGYGKEDVETSGFDFLHKPFTLKNLEDKICKSF